MPWKIPPENYKGLFTGDHMLGGTYEDANWRKIGDAFFAPDGTSSRWNDGQVGGLNVGLGANAPDLIAFMGDSDIKIYGFDGLGAVTEVITGLMQLTHGYEPGTELKAHVHWVPSTADSGNVVWQLSYSWANVNDVFGALNPQESSPDAADAQWKHQVTPIYTMDGTGKRESSFVVFKLFRDPTHASDTYAADAGLLGIDFHAKVNKLGTVEEFPGA